MGRAALFLCGALLSGCAMAVIPQSAEQLESAAAHSCLLRGDGHVRCWGTAAGVAAGPGPDVPRYATATEVQNVEGAVGLAVGAGHACVVVADGSALCWGDNSFGELGVGAPARSESAVRVVGLDDAVQVGSMGGHSCARRATGRVVCWGDNSLGQLGDGSSVPFSAAPVEVAGIDDAVDVSAGEFGSCAVLSGGAVRCWGRALSGQLGDGVSTHGACGGGGMEPCSAVPVEVAGLTDAVRVRCGLNASCALRGDGTVWCWGWGSSGQLGNGDALDRATPTAVPGLSAVTEVRSGYLRFCALDAVRGLVCWGDDVQGALGGGVGALLAPAEVPGVTDARTVAGGWYHLCVLEGGGGVRCLGDNQWNQLGDGTTTARATLGLVLGL